ncbi:hypothetical protein KDW_39950 [Dictyobacter vulcani]|uniref:Uncharacterized protein n=1 Tax=Dictyobacter vulcani TaxID=2607529 RepID=A0A5J4KQF5_9CHLR|nr:hypothetical protein KDW_39950 [Dictyobacter vulcani]
MITCVEHKENNLATVSINTQGPKAVGWMIVCNDFQTTLAAESQDPRAFEAERNTYS